MPIADIETKLEEVRSQLEVVGKEYFDEMVLQGQPYNHFISDGMKALQLHAEALQVRLAYLKDALNYAQHSKRYYDKALKSVIEVTTE